MIDLAILGLLKEQELHGYELRKRVADLLGPGRGGLSFGSLYPALNRLERAGHVKAVEANTRPPRSSWSSGSLAGELAAFRARLPRAGARGGRGRKVYGITEPGEARLIELLTEAGPRDERTFALRVALCRFLNAAQRLDLFQRRRRELADQLADLSTRGAGRATPQHRYLRSLREHDLETITCDLAWLDRLISEEREQPASKEDTNQ